MKIKFAWKPHARLPTCTSDTEVSEGVSPLDCLLSDDGGLGLDEAILWAEEGARLAKAVMSGESAALNWDNECWGARIDMGQTTVSSLYDETCAYSLSTKMFAEILARWAAFMKVKERPSTLSFKLD